MLLITKTKLHELDFNTDIHIQKLDDIVFTNSLVDHSPHSELPRNLNPPFLKSPCIQMASIVVPYNS